MIKMTNARRSHILSKSWLFDQQLKDHAPISVAKLEIDIAYALTTLTETEQEIIHRTAMTRQQENAIPAVATDLNTSVELVKNTRKLALNKLKNFLMTTKFPSVTCRIYRIPGFII